MQTFLPYGSCFYLSATVLDNKRLNKQILEAYQIYTDRVPTLNHPACLMWANYKHYLRLYIRAMVEEYSLRFGKRHKVDKEMFQISRDWYMEQVLTIGRLPGGIDHPWIRLSHIVNLIRKDPDWYLPKLQTPFKFHSNILCKRVPAIDEFPEGYWWPVMPVGKKARADKTAWEKFFNGCTMTWLAKPI